MERDGRAASPHDERQKEPCTNGADPAPEFSWRRFYSLFKLSWRRDTAREKLKIIGLMATILPLLVVLGAIIGWNVWENAQQVTNDKDSILKAATNVAGGMILMTYSSRIYWLVYGDRVKTFGEALKEALPWTAEIVSQMAIVAYLLFWLSTEQRLLLHWIGWMCVWWLWSSRFSIRNRAGSALRFLMKLLAFRREPPDPPVPNKEVTVDMCDVN